MAKLLLINPSYFQVYATNQAGLANPVYPILSLSALAGVASSKGHQVQILDLSYRPYEPKFIKQKIAEGKPDIVGITATTPLVNQLRDLSFLIKDVSPEIITVGGGAHPSSLPHETMQESCLDMIVAGEGEYTLLDILESKNPADIPGIYWRKNGQIIANAPRPLIENLDILPFPAWNLYPIDEYRERITKIICKYPPLNTIEFSRGCVFKCDFCASKNTMGLGYRKKSPKRCAEEMAYLENLGYREALLVDDIFTSDNNWAIQVCEAIIRKKLKIAWTCTNGIRVDSANSELFKAMKRAGCYRVHFGFESGNDNVLKAFGKGGRATKEQGIRAVEQARSARLETWGFFMLALSADNEETIKDTLLYARKVRTDIKKFGITTPFPGTPMFYSLHADNRLKTYNWDEYNVYNESDSIYEHPRLSWNTIQRYYKKAYFETYYKDPAYIFQRIWKVIKTLELFSDAYLAIKFLILLFKKTPLVRNENYAYRKQWEPLNVRPQNIRSYTFPKAVKYYAPKPEQE